MCGSFQGLSRIRQEPLPATWDQRKRLGGIGYLTVQPAVSGDFDHVVALEEAWVLGCSRCPVRGRPAQSSSIGLVREPWRGRSGPGGVVEHQRINQSCPSRISRLVRLPPPTRPDEAFRWWVNGPGRTRLHRRASTNYDTRLAATTPPPLQRPPCRHVPIVAPNWHAGHPKHTRPGTNHDGTHRSGKCAGF